ncbi:MAG: TlpA disulfide reductase family protein [Planctomycetota bacterium]|nr:TlpA disulfide reductase family protein [Planctomycetota bacterium]
MNTRRSLSFAALVCVAAVVAFILTGNAAQRENDTQTLVGKPAPDFTLKTLDGQEVKLSSLKGSVVVVDFWATWCPPCRKSLPHLQTVSKNEDLAKNGLKVLAVNALEKQDKVEEFVKQNSYSFTIPMDASGDTMKEYRVQGIPTTVIVGRDGNIKNVFVGYGGEESGKQLDKAIDAALAEAKPAA